MNVEREVEKLRGEMNALLEAQRSGTIWIDYSSLSTVTGWASFTTKEIYYARVGKIVFVRFRLIGVSNADTATFTVPYASIGGGAFLDQMVVGADNGVYTDARRIQLGLATTTVNAYATLGLGAWTASGTKAVIGSFWYVAG